MKTIEIKKKLINEINLSENKNLLEEFYRFLNLENEIEENYKLNSQQKSAIAEAREQIKNGDYLTNEQANQEIDEWLNKQFGQEERKPIEKKFLNIGIKETNPTSIVKS